MDRTDNNLVHGFDEWSVFAFKHDSVSPILSFMYTDNSKLKGPAEVMTS